jgi:hypothetical protein
MLCLTYKRAFLVQISVPEGQFGLSRVINKDESESVPTDQRVLLFPSDYLTVYSYDKKGKNKMWNKMITITCSKNPVTLSRLHDIVLV